MTATIMGVVLKKEERLTKADKPKKYILLLLQGSTGDFFLNCWNLGLASQVEEGDAIEAVCTTRMVNKRTFYNVVELRKLDPDEEGRIREMVADNEGLDTSEPPAPREERVGLSKDESIVRQVCFKCAARVLAGTDKLPMQVAAHAFELERAFYAGPESK